MLKVLKIQQMIDAAIAAENSLQIKPIPGPGLNPRSFAKKAETLPLTIAECHTLFDYTAVFNNLCISTDNNYYYEVVKHWCIVS